MPIPSNSDISAAQLLSKLEQLSDRGSEVEAERRQIWQDLMRVTGLSQESMEKLLHELLSCQIITARRWLTGKFTPRRLAILTLRRHWEAFDPDSTSASASEPLVEFQGSKIAIQSLGHFFSRLEHAKLCLCAKGWLAFKAGRYPGARDEMVRILRANQDLHAHYVFSPDSEAQRTLETFLAYLRTAVAPEILARVHAWTTMANPPESDGLRYNIASPFILVYSDDGAKRFGRPLDVWYELPVAAHFAAQGLDLDTREPVEYILVELPSNDALALWQVWRELFVKTVRANLHSSDPQRAADERWMTDLFHRLSLPGEEPKPGTSLAKLQDALK